MRILRLNLLAFGPFTNSTLDFGASGAPLHIVYGPNEAGKSSCLRALRAWLFEIPAQNNDDFLHQYSNMRIGGLIEGSSGEKLEFVRRKAKSKTLRAIDDQQIVEDSELIRFLDGVDQATFEQRFAFDYQELQSAGEQIAKGTGQLAEILFAAGAGITHLRDVQKSLDEQIQGLYKSRGTNATINSALHSWKESRDRIKELSLTTSDWEKQCELLAEAQQRLIDNTYQLSEARTSHSRCSRLLKAVPLVHKLDFTQVLLKEVDAAPVLPVDFGQRRSLATDRRSDAEQRLRETQAEINRLQRMLSEVTLPEALLQHRSMISGLHTELGSYQKAAKDRPRLMAELHALKLQAERLCVRIGWEPDLVKAATFKLPLLQRKRIDSLASEWTALITQQDELQKTETKLRKAAAKLESEADNQIAQFDIEGLKQIHRRALRYVDSEHQLEQLRRKAKSIGREIHSKLSRLPQSQGSIERLVGLPVPLKETIERVQRDWRACDDQISKREDKIEDLNQRIRKLDRKIEKLQLEHDVPTEDDLRSARDRRDIGWQLLRRIISGDISIPSENEAVGEFLKAYPGKEDFLHAFHACIEFADLIADRLRREALRVSEKSNWTSERHELLDQLASEQTQLDQAKCQKQTIERQWQESWQLAEIQPLTPDEMLAWISSRDELVDMSREQTQTQEELNILEAQVTELTQVILANFRKLKNSEMSAGGSLTEALGNCETIIQELDAANQQVVMRAQRLEKLHEDLADTLDERRQLDERLERWRQEWSASVGDLGQSKSIRPDEAQEMLREIEQINVTLSEIEDIQRRVAGIDRDALVFSAKVTHLLSEAALDLEQPVDQSALDLHQRLQDALAAQFKVQEWQEQLRLQLSRNDKAATDLEYWQEVIRSLCSMAGCDSVDDLPDAEHRSIKRQQCEKEVTEYRESLIELAGSEPLPEFLDCVRTADADQLTSEFQQLAEKIAGLETEKAESAKVVGARQADLNRMDGSAQAAQAQEDMEHHLSSIRSGSEQYIRLRLADMLLKRSIERFREANQGPVLSRASQLFAELTLGSFSGLRADFDDHGKAVLVGVRGDGVNTVGISGMSTGTCDQLYMALRLAMIEIHALDHHPMPLIIDDVLIQFDDQRSAAALRLFGELAEHTQVIYFTHHQRIVELAKQNLEPARFAIHNLPQN